MDHHRDAVARRLLTSECTRPPRARPDTAARAIPDPAGRAPPARSHLDTLLRDDLASADPRCVKTIKVRKGKDVVIHGSHHDFVYVNRDGWLVRYKILHNGSRQIMDFILPGQVFGLPACLFQRALYSVAAIQQTTLLKIPLGVVDNLFERNPRLAKALFWSSAHEAAILGEHLIDAARRSAYERVGHLLLELFIRLNPVDRNGEMTFSIPLTQELIADALGLTTVHVNRTLRALREDKLIAMDRRSITIIDFEALSQLSDFENCYLGEAALTLRGGARPYELDRQSHPVLL
jgi:CRP-like cAMP-binding protein